MSTDSIAKLGKELGQNWPTIKRARTDAQELKSLLAETLDKAVGSLGSDIDFVVFGSLARNEWTSGSDIDWTLLVDGQADAGHQQVANQVRQTLEEVKFRGKNLVEPGSSGVFGNMTFSHDLVHLIGGDTDSNHNLTRRILLLLESCPIRNHEQSELHAYDRAVSSVLNRYISNDANVLKLESPIPRFLLNDIARYWRTLCVDFGWKEWEQAGKKWALRNVKLRMSRKLLFASGLLMAFSCQEFEEENGPVDQGMVWNTLIKQVYRTPLEIVVDVLSNIELQENAGELLDHYEKFLHALDDPETRKSLGKLQPKDVYDDPDYGTMRGISHDFQSVLTQVFFDSSSPLGEFTQNYGVF